jgi:hypothetical protein
MPLYLVVHTPVNPDDQQVRAPSRMVDLARASLAAHASPRWLKTWSPDLHDDRLFSLWEAENGAEIHAVLAHYGFLDNMDAKPIRVHEWGPEDVLMAEASGADQG